MQNIYLDTNDIASSASALRAGQRVYLSGTIYTARDAAHLRLIRLLENNDSLPFDIKGAIIYYAGPTPEKNDGTIGSFGPTTSSRMDVFTPVLLEKGLRAMIGKGDRSPFVIDAIKKNSAVYFCAGGGFGALISKSIVSVEVIAFPELGCESIKKLSIKNLPLIVGIDSQGNSVFDRQRE